MDENLYDSSPNRFIKKDRGAGKMAQWVRALTALPKVLSLKPHGGPGMVAHAFKPSTREAEAGGFLSSRPAWSTK
jgi:major histocompatibility complex class I